MYSDHISKDAPAHFPDARARPRAAPAAARSSLSAGALRPAQHSTRKKRVELNTKENSGGGDSAGSREASTPGLWLTRFPGGASPSRTRGSPAPSCWPSPPATGAGRARQACGLLTRQLVQVRCRIRSSSHCRARTRVRELSNSCLGARQRTAACADAPRSRASRISAEPVHSSNMSLDSGPNRTISAHF